MFYLPSRPRVDDLTVLPLSMLLFPLINGAISSLTHGIIAIMLSELEVDCTLSRGRLKGNCERNNLSDPEVS